jgi:hypothetical protein
MSKELLTGPGPNEESRLASRIALIEADEIVFDACRAAHRRANVGYTLDQQTPAHTLRLKEAAGVRLTPEESQTALLSEMDDAMLASHPAVEMAELVLYNLLTAPEHT